MRRGLVTIGTVVALAASAGCGGGNAAKHGEASQTVSRDLTGFGATMGAWNRTHTKDHRYPAENVYDADPSMRLAPGKLKDHYGLVVFTDNRVLHYFYLFSYRPIAAAKADVLRTQFPRDAEVVWFAVKEKLCAAMIVKSETLAKVLGPKYFEPQGLVLVYFSSSRPHYDPKAVDQAEIVEGDVNGPGLRRAKKGPC